MLDSQLRDSQMLEPKKILQVLRAELALQTRHCRLLEAQELALLSCDRAKFVSLQEEHSLMLLELEAQDILRRDTLKDEAGTALTITMLREFLPLGSLPSLTALEDSLRLAVDRVQELTRRNRVLIQNELDYLAFTLDLFVEAGRCADTCYGGSGRASGRLLLDRVA